MDEQIIEQMKKAWRVADWRAVYAVVERHLKAKYAESLLPNAEDNEELDARLDDVVNTWNWDQLSSSPDKKRVQQMLRDACCIYHSKLADRKRRFLAPEPKERVTIEQLPGSCVDIVVFLDGKRELGFVNMRDAERYAAGLRAELEGK